MVLIPIDNEASKEDHTTEATSANEDHVTPGN